MAEHVSFPNSEKLNKSGYRFGNEVVDLQGALENGRGVYNLEQISVNNGVPDNLLLHLCDPGQAKPINVCSIPASVLEGIDLDTMFNSCWCIRDTEYHEATLSIKNSLKEEIRRRNTPYGEALGEILTYKCRTSCLQTFLEFCRKKSELCWTIWGETLKKVRSMHRFLRFKAQQSVIDKLADRIVGGNENSKRTLVLFGRASFRAQKGRASAPRKKLVRALANRCLVGMTSEYGSSKYCWCGAELVDIGNRIRRCTNDNFGGFHCPLFGINVDRDDVGSCGIGRNAIPFLFPYLV
jgi:hypothetical protein